MSSQQEIDLNIKPFAFILRLSKVSNITYQNDIVEILSCSILDCLLKAVEICTLTRHQKTGVDTNVTLGSVGVCN